MKLRITLVLLGSSLLLGACAFTPGMHYDEMVDTETRTYDYNGTRVDLVPVPLAVAQSRDVSQHNNSKPALIPADLLQYKTTPYKLGVGDVITVVVWEHPELTTPLGQFRTDNAAGQAIAPDGSIYYPYVGVFQAAGHTAAELRTQITQALAKVLKDPQVDVKITSYASQKVFLTGELKTPGVVPLTEQPLTLADALHKAGGFTPNADMGRVELVRGGKNYLIDISACYKTGTSLDNVYLQAGDQLRVAPANERKVYLMGEVGTASAIPMVNGRMTLVQALAEAKGYDRMSAAGEKIYVIRFQQPVDSVPQAIEVFHLNARNPLMLAVGDQFELQPRDVVFIAATDLARWNRFVSLILPTAQLLNNGAGTANNIQNLTE